MSYFARLSILRLGALSLGLLAVLALASSCGDNPQAHVVAALDRADLDEIEASWDARDGALMLKGSVDDWRKREQAEAIATTTLAGGGRVINDITVQGQKQPLDAADDEILDRLQRLVETDLSLSEREVDFFVLNGTVTIRGQVGTDEEKAQLERLARRVNGVRAVANAVEVQG